MKHRYSKKKQKKFKEEPLIDPGGPGFQSTGGSMFICDLLKGDPVTESLAKRISKVVDKRIFDEISPRPLYINPLPGSSLTTICNHSLLNKKNYCLVCGDLILYPL